MASGRDRVRLHCQRSAWSTVMRSAFPGTPEPGRARHLTSRIVGCLHERPTLTPANKVATISELLRRSRFASQPSLTAGIRRLRRKIRSQSDPAPMNNPDGLGAASFVLGETHFRRLAGLTNIDSTLRAYGCQTFRVEFDDVDPELRSASSTSAGHRITRDGGRGVPRPSAALVRPNPWSPLQRWARQPTTAIPPAALPVEADQVRGSR